LNQSLGLGAWLCGKIPAQQVWVPEVKPNTIKKKKILPILCLILSSCNFPLYPLDHKRSCILIHFLCLKDWFLIPLHIRLHCPFVSQYKSCSQNTFYNHPVLLDTLATAFGPYPNTSILIVKAFCASVYFYAEYFCIFML
jgi:hypothetical protein